MKKKHLILLALAANAHVHGVDNDISLGKKKKSEQEQGQNAPNKGQKTKNPAIVEQSNALPKSEKAIAEQSDTLIKHNSRTTREVQNNPLPEKEMYCEQTGKWVKLQGGVNANGCFVYSSSTLYVPNKPDVFETLEKIISETNIGPKVHHVIIDFPNLQWPNRSFHTINKLFTDKKNNSVTWQCPPLDWDLAHNCGDPLSNVQNLTLEGKTGNEVIYLALPADMDNKRIDVKNANYFHIKHQNRLLKSMGTVTATCEKGVLTGEATEKEGWIEIHNWDKDGWWYAIGVKGTNSKATSTYLRNTYAQSDGYVIYATTHNDGSVHCITGFGPGSTVAATNNGIATGKVTDNVVYTVAKNGKECQRTDLRSPNIQLYARRPHITRLSGKNLVHQQYNEDGSIFAVSSSENTDVTAFFDSQQKSTHIKGQDLIFETYIRGVLNRFKTQGTNVEFTRTEGSNGMLHNAQYIVIEKPDQNGEWDALYRLSDLPHSIDIKTLAYGT